MKGSSICMLAAAGFVLLMAACSKDSEDKLAADSGTGTTCDTTLVKYSTDVVPILQNNCYSCHGQNNSGGSGGIVLEGYANISAWANRGYVKGNVQHAAGFVAMPYGKPKLADCEVNKIAAWVNQGVLDN